MFHVQVFTLAEMLVIIEERGLAGEMWGNNLPGSWANYVEAQVWNRELLMHYVQQVGM